MSKQPPEEPPICLLEALASLEEQRRNMINGTAEEYLVPDEILNDAWHFCERANYPGTHLNLTEDQRGAIGRLREALDRLGGCTALYEHSNIAELVERDECWAVMRDRAGEVMLAFGNPVPD